MITTKANIKTLLKLSNTTYDDLIDLELPLIQDDVLSFLRNKFIVKDFVLQADTISFTGNTILDSGNGFASAGFFTGNIVVQDSKANNGFYTLSTIEPGLLTVEEDFITESAGKIVKINQVAFPKALQLIIADIVGYKLNVKHGVKSESFSRYSVTYANDGQNLINGYPDSIIKPILKWRRVYNDY